MAKVVFVPKIPSPSPSPSRGEGNDVKFPLCLPSLDGRGLRGG